MSLESGAEAKGLGGEMVALLTLAWPIIVGQVGYLTMGVVDTVVVGRLGAEPMAALALGHFWSLALSVFGLNTLRGLDPFFSQAFGAGDHHALRRVHAHALFFGLVLSVPIALAHLGAGLTMRFFGQPEAAVVVAHDYSVAVALGMAPLLVAAALAQFLQGLGRVLAPMVVVVFANLVNLVLDLVLVLGADLGPLGQVPAFGAEGCGWATTGVRWFSLPALLLVARRPLRAFAPLWRRPFFAPGELPRLLRVSVPVGAHGCLEMWAFFALGLMMGRLGTEALAGHSVAMNMISLTYMVSFGLAGAASIRVGHLIGRGAPWGRCALTAVGLGAGFMAFSGLGLVYFAERVGGLFTHDAAVILVVAALLPVGGAFQVFDGTQVVAAGVLRGAGDTAFSAWANAVGHWIVGLPVGAVAGLVLFRTPGSVWWGMALGLAFVAIASLARLRQILRRGPRRVIE